MAERKHQNRKGGPTQEKQEKRVERVRGKQRVGGGGCRGVGEGKVVGRVWKRKEGGRQSVGEKGRFKAECGSERKVARRV